MNGVLPAADDPATHVIIWSNTPTVMTFGGNHLVSAAEGDLAWWERLGGCESSERPATSSGKGGALNASMQIMVNMQEDGLYTLCMDMAVSNTQLGVVEHAHVTMRVLHRSPMLPPSPPPPSLPPEFCIRVENATAGDSWCGKSLNEHQYQQSDYELIRQRLGESRAPPDKWTVDVRYTGGWRMCDLDLLGCFQACFAINASCNHVSFGGGESGGCCFMSNVPCNGGYRTNDHKFYLSLEDCETRRSLHAMPWVDRDALRVSSLRPLSAISNDVDH